MQPVPRLADQTYGLLGIQVFVNGLATLVLTGFLMVAGDRSDRENITGLIGVLALIVGAVLPGMAAGRLRHGRPVGWVLGLLTQMFTAVAIVVAWTVGFFAGVLLLVLGGLAIWITVNLFRAEVRQYVFRRRVRV